jgi:hypothetical protein
MFDACLVLGPQLTRKYFGLILGSFGLSKPAEAFEHGVSEGSNDGCLARWLG